MSEPEADLLRRAKDAFVRAREAQAPSPADTAPTVTSPEAPTAVGATTDVDELLDWLWLQESLADSDLGIVADTLAGTTASSGTGEPAQLDEAGSPDEDSDPDGRPDDPGTSGPGQSAPRTESDLVKGILLDSLAQASDPIGVFTWPGGALRWSNDALTQLAPGSEGSPAFLQLLDEWSQAHFVARVLPALLSERRWRGTLRSARPSGGSGSAIEATIIAHGDPANEIDSFTFLAHVHDADELSTQVPGPGVRTGPTSGQGPSDNLDAKQKSFESQLRHALDTDGIVIRYQPIIDTSTGSITGAEALLRLRGEVGELLNPSAFVEVAESTGLIAELGDAVLAMTCRQLARTGIDVSVNISPQQISTTGFSDGVMSILADTGLAPDRLCVEITEGTILSQGEQTETNILALREHGVRVGIDELGSGRTSIGALRRFPLDFVKIDRTLVAGLVANYVDGAIARSAIDLAHQLGLQVVAVGVESDAQLETLRKLGCDKVQGHLFAGAIEIHQLRARIKG